MPGYNGLISSLIKGSSTGGENAVLTGVSRVSCSAALPAKHFEHAILGVLTSGVSGTYAVNIVGAVGGCTFLIAGQTGIATNGSVLVGTTTTGIAGVARPAYVSFESAEAGSGFTSSVYLAGQY